MASLTATVSETRSNFSKIAESVCKTGKPVTVIRNSKPWVVISPAGTNSEVPLIDWSKIPVLEPDPDKGYAVLPSETDFPEDEGLYDDLV